MQSDSESELKTVSTPISKKVEPEDPDKDKTLVELLNLMDDFHPMIPEAIMDFYLMKSGIETEDVKLKRLLSLATQKFISDLAGDALQHSKIRTSQQKDKRKSGKQTLTIEDLTAACSEYGISVKRPQYFL